MVISGTVQVEWQKCDDGNGWCRLADVNLGSVGDGDGVYIIWTDHGRVLYVGQGKVRDRLRTHRTDPRIQQFSDGGLWVTWAFLADPATRDGVERHLADQFAPSVGEAHPRVFPLAVNHPR
jgi:hypothetical protein